MIASLFPASRFVAGAALALTLAAALLPCDAAARSLNLEDLIEQENRQRILEQQKLDRFEDPELFALLREANMSLTNGDFATAEERARELTELSPGSPQGWHLLGLALANLGNADGAIGALDKADTLYDVNAGPLVAKGELLLARGNVEAARRAFLAAVEKDPADWRAQESLGSIALASGDNSTAISRFENVVGLAAPDYFEPRVQLASLYLVEERIDDAKEVLESFAEANPEHPGVRVALGRIAFSEGRNDEAERLFDAAVSLKPESPGLRIFKARAQLNAGRTDAAEQTLVAAQSDLPGNREVQLELAALYGVTRDYARAADAFRSGLDTWPDDPAFRSGLSQAAYRAGDYETALEQAAALAERTEASAGDHFWHAVVLERVGRVEPAIAAYETAVEGNPENWIALNNLASLLTETAPARAVTLAERAEQASGGVDQVKSTLGWALFSAGEAERALPLLREIADRNPENAVFAYRLGRILIETGEADAGRDMVARALSLDPEFRNAEEARRLLSSN